MCFGFLCIVSGKYKVPSKCPFSLYHLYSIYNMTDIVSCLIVLCPELFFFFVIVQPRPPIHTHKSIFFVLWHKDTLLRYLWNKVVH